MFKTVGVLSQIFTLLLSIVGLLTSSILNTSLDFLFCLLKLILDLLLDIVISGIFYKLLELQFLIPLLIDDIMAH